MSEKTFLKIVKPDDWHVHLRDGDILEKILPFTARQFSRAIVMPNLIPPITTVSQGLEYRERINTLVSKHFNFQPLMTFYLTDETNIGELKEGKKQEVFYGAKLYPAGATTNSSLGVTNISKIFGVLECLEKIGLPLLVHGEVTDLSVDIFDREAVFIDKIMEPIIRDFPGLKIVFEHVSSAEGVQFIESSDANVAATVTAHHLMINRNDIFNGGIRPHMYCLPLAKTKYDQCELRRAVTSGSQRFFLGTDSAPHLVAEKENECGCAGIFSAPAALEMYIQVFDEEGALDRFEAFASFNGPRFYGLPTNSSSIRLKKTNSKVPERVTLSKGREIRPFWGGKELSWSLLGTSN